MASRPTSSSSTTDLLEVGRIARAHGLKGDVVVDLVTNRPERTELGSIFTTASGSELHLERIAPLPGRWIMGFAGFTSRESAERLRGEILFADALQDDEAIWVHELIGTQVFDLAGNTLGLVSGVLDNPASDLLELEGGGLIPLRFIVERTKESLVADIPPGLFDLT